MTTVSKERAMGDEPQGCASIRFITSVAQRSPPSSLAHILTTIHILPYCLPNQCTSSAKTPADGLCFPWVVCVCSSLERVRSNLRNQLASSVNS
jgi:hypothetical protein